MNGADDLELLIRSRYPVIVVDTLEETRLEELLGRVAERLGIPLFLWSRTRGLARAEQKQGIYNTDDPSGLFAHLEAADADGVYLLADLHPYLADPLVARKLREVAQRFTGARRGIVLCGAGLDLPPGLGGQSVPFELKLPGPEELKEEVRRVVGEYDGKASVRLTRREAEQLIENMRGLTLDEARRSLHQALLDDGRLEGSDLHHFQEAKKASVARTGLLEFYPTPDTLDRVGGMGNLKQWLEKRREALSEQAREFGLDPPKGILLIGVQGCGKSLLARSVSATWAIPLVRLDPSALYDKYIGETEKNLRHALDTVEVIAPVVLWIDEIEKALAGGSAEDGGVSTRLLGTLLTWIQERESGIFVVATANDISALPPELLRKGRFDEIFFVDLPTEPERRDILIAHLEKRSRHVEDFDLDALVAATEGFSGSELEQAIVAGLYTAFAAKHDLTTEVLLEEIEVAVPLSITMAEKVAGLRAWAQGRTVPAG